MWTFKQTTGELLHDGLLIGHGYSGYGTGLDNPQAQSIPDVGPIPQGTYTIGQAFTHPEKGPLVMRLIPDASDNEYGRAGFMIHGDSQAMNHTASLGCIILMRRIRELIAESSDKRLEVIA